MILASLYLSRLSDYLSVKQAHYLSVLYVINVLLSVLTDPLLICTVQLSILMVPLSLLTVPLLVLMIPLPVFLWSHCLLVTIRAPAKWLMLIGLSVRDCGDSTPSDRQALPLAGLDGSWFQQSYFQF